MSNNNQRGTVTFVHVLIAIVLLAVVQYLLLDRSIDRDDLGRRGTVITGPSTPKDSGGEPPYMRRFRLFNGSDEDVSDLRVQAKKSDGTWDDITDDLKETGDPLPISGGQGWGPGGHEQAGFVYGVKVTVTLGTEEHICLVSQINAADPAAGYQDVEIFVVIEKMTWDHDSDTDTPDEETSVPRMWLLRSHSSVSHKKGPIRYDDPTDDSSQD